jgi:hypothetical protein
LEPGDRIIRIEGGWEACAALSNYGRVFVWHPTSLDEEAFHQYSTHINSSNGPWGEMTVPIPVVRGAAIECHVWKMSRVATEELPAIATDLLPELHKDSPQGLDVKLTQIALGESTMIGLTNGEHVLAFPFGQHRARGGGWIYVCICGLSYQLIDPNNSA